MRDGDFVLAKQSSPARKRAPGRKPRTKRPTGKGTGAGLPASKKSSGLSEWLSPKNIQESIKSVNNVRGIVKNCLNYLQQADQMLETFYVTSNSLRETGVLDKIVKSRGKNLTTEDFTGILAALMSSPLGGHLFKSMAGGSDEPDSSQPQGSPAPPNTQG